MRALLDPVDERTGLIRWVMDIPVEPGEPRLFNASAKMADVTAYNARSCYDNNGGSGPTRDDARSAAIGECLERYCCAVYAAEDLVCGTLGEARSWASVRAPSEFALFHPDESNGTADAGPIGWTWAWSLTRRAPALVPACLVYMPYFPCSPDRDEIVPAPAMSTGLACARTRDEAVLAGLYECIERDAFMITWMNRLPCPNIDPHDSGLRETSTSRLDRRGLRRLLFETTTDIPVPSFLCLLVDESRDPPMICAGGAAHLDPVRAAAKAMREAVQTREWAKFLRDDAAAPYAADFHDVADFEDHVRLYAYGDMRSAISFLERGDLVPRPGGWRSGSTGSVAEDLGLVTAMLGSRQVEVMATDLTTVDVRDCGFWVTRTITPELQPLDASHTRRFLGGRRMYEVPWRLGHTSEPTTRHQLNPHPHPFP